MIAIFPEIAQCIQRGNVELLGLLIRKYFGREQASSPGLSTQEVVASFGLGFAKRALGYPGALAIHDEKGKFSAQIVVDDNLGGFDDRFLTSYLLGLYLIKVQPSIVQAKISKTGYKVTENPVPRYESSRFLSQDDAFALRFAASLILPKRFILNRLDKGQTPGQVAQDFGVPDRFLAKRVSDFEEATGQATKSKLFEQDNAVEPAGNRATGAVAQQKDPEKRDDKEPLIKHNKKDPARLINIEKIRELARKIDSTV